MKALSGFVHLLLIVVILVVVGIGVGVYLLVFKGKISLPGQTAKPTVEVKKEYRNPFAKSSQYVNPFDEFKSPFLNLK